MFNATDLNNQPTQPSMPEQPQQKFQFVPKRKRFSFSKIPVMAQITGLLSLLVIGAGLLTVNQLSQTSQDLSSQAAFKPAVLNYESPNATMGFNQEKTFNIVMTTPQGMQTSAAIIRMWTAHNDMIEVVKISPVANKFPVVLKGFALEHYNAPTRSWAATFGANPNATLTGTQTIATVTVKSKDKAGTAQLNISSSSEIAAFGNAGNVYDGSYKPLQIAISSDPGGSDTCWNLVVENGNETFWPNACKGAKPDPELVCAAVTVPLTAEEKQQYNTWKSQGSVVPPGCSPTPPVTVDACISKTATKVNGNERIPLTANAKVKPGDTIEYTITVGTKSDTTRVDIDDRFPLAYLEYVNGSAKIDGATATVNATEITKNILQVGYNVPQANRGKQNKLTYQVKVKQGLTGGEFENNANVKFNNNNAMSEYCSFNLGVDNGTEPPTDLKLSVKFQIQGVLTPGVTETGDLSIRYPNQQDFSKKVVKTYPNVKFTSGANGVFTSEMVALTDLPEVINGEMEIFVKTPTTLRKMIGITGHNRLKQLGPEVTEDFSHQILFVGDFDRTVQPNNPELNQENFFRITDVSAMLSQFKRASNPVTAENKEYDLDKNNVINILDVSIILSNFTKASVGGDTL